MIKLNLEAKTKEQERVKSYLEANASEVLAEKINDGVIIVKDGKTLINKKTLEGFMKFAQEEARKQVEKGARCACIDDDVVFGWAIHYFEEETIEELLYNEDGTAVKAAPTKPAPAPKKETSKAKPKEKQQTTLFDFLDSTNTSSSSDDEENDEDEEENEETAECDDDDDTEESVEETPTIPTEWEIYKPSKLYQTYLDHQAKHPSAILFMQIGDFYEAFGNNAINAGNELNLTITGRDCGLKERVPMVGIPYHAAEPYFTRLSKGYDVLIVDCDSSYRFIENLEDREKRKIIKTDEFEADEETGEILSYDEMREFDGDIDEKVITKDIEEHKQETDDVPELEASKYIDKDAMCVLMELFDYEMDLQ